MIENDELSMRIALYFDFAIFPCTMTMFPCIQFMMKHSKLLLLESFSIALDIDLE